jgi:hypothetical protein
MQRSSLVVKYYSYIRISASVNCPRKGIGYVLKMTSAFPPNMKASGIVNFIPGKND